ncbi:hypothetical protein HY490_05060 [Candidatus Woesearchaeota archaeon]|nr:hypothetical protein [Candidatus Woesearchaeota archaeon]
MSKKKLTVAHAWKTKILGYAGGVSGGATVLGSYQLCHSICLGIISLLSIIGITVVGMPLMFLNTISVPVWILAVVMLAVTGVLAMRHACVSRKLLLANFGLIVAGTPFRAVQPYQLLVWIVGGGIVLTSIVLAVGKGMKTKKQKTTVATWILGTAVVVVLGLVIFNTYTLVNLNSAKVPQAPMMGSPMTRMQFTAHDQMLAHEMMDENGDGMCDTCGMPIDQCIASGMMECSMASDAKIGLLGSSHHHVDWKIYLNGEAIDMSPYGLPLKDPEKGSMFAHMEGGSPEEKIGDVIHFHATGVTLNFLLDSIGMKLSPTCFTTDMNEYCSTSQLTLKFFVNGKPNNENGDYIPQNGDQILISYGPNNEDVSKQLESVTSFARNYYTKRGQK